MFKLNKIYVICIENTDFKPLTLRLTTITYWTHKRNIITKYINDGCINTATCRIAMQIQTWQKSHNGEYVTFSA